MCMCTCMMSSLIMLWLEKKNVWLARTYALLWTVAATVQNIANAS
jgi:hypothetical protein